MKLYNDKYEMCKTIRLYLTKNKETIEREYNITIPNNIHNNFSTQSLVAYLQVYSSKILMAKQVKECVEFKNMVKDFIILNQAIANAESFEK